MKRSVEDDEFQEHSRNHDRNMDTESQEPALRRAGIRRLDVADCGAFDNGRL
ncbi:hypothetical protein ACU8KH_03244 [Lachancea thermotolerans]